MWTENDQMMKLVEAIEQERVSSSEKCPACGAAQAHFLLHKANEASGKGTAWIWCDECKSYSHFSYFVPGWWENPDFIDVKKLDSGVEYPHSIESEIDEWIRVLAHKG